MNIFVNFIKKVNEKKELENFYQNIRDLVGEIGEVTEPNTLDDVNVNNEFSRKIYPYTGKVFQKLKHTENYVILWEHYIKGSVCSIYDKKDIKEDTTTKTIKEIVPIIEYADQTIQYKGKLMEYSINDINLTDYEKFKNVMIEVNELHENTLNKKVNNKFKWKK